MRKLGNQDIFLFWGKAQKEGSLSHPTVCHMLDVGIMSRELLKVQSPQIRDRILSIFGPARENGLAFFTALHDIGKISPGFQMKREDLCVKQKDRGFDFPKSAESKHGKICACCLAEILNEEFKCPYETASVFSHVLAAHHGVFVTGNQFIDGNNRWYEARKNIVRFLADTFQIDTLEAITLPSTANALLVAGLLTESDWLGSSEAHFSYLGKLPFNTHEYISDRTERAKTLIKELRMNYFVKKEGLFEQIFPFPPNNCQKAVMKVASQLQHPMLIVVESPTGTGKTEAAQAVFSHIAPRDGIRGMYYALPTQATGNAMFPRMKTFIDKLDPAEKSELHLIHANADLNQDYEELKIKSVENPEESIVATSWFTARKRGLLANYGTGTIDQALMAVLKVRHFFLRLFGLSGKLIVLDEIHAYDAYMTEEISRLIGWLPYCDSSVVLLSATLPNSRRQQLLESFAPGTTSDLHFDYPCVIGVDTAGSLKYEEIKELEHVTVVIEPIISSQEEKAGKIVQLLAEKLVDGGCAACILNTVSEAQKVYEQVEKHINDAGDLLLFHARFTLENRLEIEDRIRKLYEKNGERPSKGIVIATQVIEQSLDIDFDFMVSDLAPIDLLLQRAGRLHRHMNVRPPLLQDRILHVLIPDIQADRIDFGGSRFVYFPDILVKTANLFGEKDRYCALKVNIPYGVSPLIETVYGNEELHISNNLQDTFEKWIEERIGTELAQLFAAHEASLADVRSFLDDPNYYITTLSNDNDDERMISSRLGRPNITLVVTEEDEDLNVCNKEDAKKFYGKSLVTDNTHLVRHFQKEDPPDQWKDVALIRHCRRLALKNGKTDLVKRIISYDKKFGLRIIGGKEAKE